MNENQSFEELVEQRRQAWSAPVAGLGEGDAPLSAARVNEAYKVDTADIMNDTVPLSRYRPERLF